MFCHNCGSKLELVDQNFCHSCGTKQLGIPGQTEKSVSSQPLDGILELLQQSENIVFLAKSSDPFHSEVHPFMFIYRMADEGFESLSEYVDYRWGDSEYANCDNCNVTFTDLNNWILDDGSNVFGDYCPKCIAGILQSRELFVESISPNEYSAWTRLKPRPEAVCWISRHYESITYVTGNSNEMQECWACAYTDTKVNLAQPHWEVIHYPGTNDSYSVPVCDGCVKQSKILIPAS